MSCLQEPHTTILSSQQPNHSKQSFQQTPTWVSLLVPTFLSSSPPEPKTPLSSQCTLTKQSQESHKRLPILPITPLHPISVRSHRPQGEHPTLRKEATHSTTPTSFR